jgi:hypothetical protein
VPITYRLRTLDNEDAGTFATTLSDWRPGLEFIAHGNRQYRIVAIEETSTSGGSSLSSRDRPARRVALT